MREARLSTCALLRLHQALVQQVCQLLQGRSIVGLRQGRGPESLEDADRLHCLQREAAGEDREAPEQLLVRLPPASHSSRQWCCAASAGALAGPVPPGWAAAGDAAVVPARQQGRAARDRRGQLERQRQPVQALADLDNGGRILSREGEIGPGLARTLDEQSYRWDLHEVLQVREVCGVRQRERRHRHDLLVTHAQGLAARHEQFEPRGQLEVLGCQRSRGNQLLGVVEHEQHVSRLQVLQQPLVQRVVPRLGHPKRSGHGRHHERRVFERGQRDERDTVCELGARDRQLPARPPASCRRLLARSASPDPHPPAAAEACACARSCSRSMSRPARHGQGGQPSSLQGSQQGS